MISNKLNNGWKKTRWSWPLVESSNTETDLGLAVNTLLTWQFGKSIKKEKVLLYLRKNLSKNERENQDVFLQIVATARFEVWSPFNSRVSIVLAEAKRVSKERTEVDNKHYKLNYEELLRVHLLPLSVYLQLNSLLFNRILSNFILILSNIICTCAPFQIRVKQTREKSVLYPQRDQNRFSPTWFLLPNEPDRQYYCKWSEFLESCWSENLN